uniref:NACHT domain-containing protein n=1 Tax=Cyprinus carpio TaxID=7962 RepID=A0A8C2CWC1_CYPCA
MFVTGWSDMILKFKASVIDKCKFVIEFNSDECVELAGRYTEPVIIQKCKEQNEKYSIVWVKCVHTFGLKPSSHLLSNDKNHSIRINQLFSPDCDGNTPKTVILSGDSGRGKSFTLQKIMLDWAFGKLYYKNFNVIFLLKCEELKCISEEMSLFELLSWSCSLTLDQISQILELTPEKVLFLIDGIDEYVSHPPSHSMLVLTNPSDRARPMDILRSVLKGILLPESFILITTRSLAADAVMNLLKGPQRFTEIVGFSERGVQEYFQKFFQDEQLFRKTYERVKINESLLTACSVPLLCWMVCFCLKKHFTDDDHVMRELKTNTSIYVHFVSTLLEHHDQSQSVLTMLRSLGQRAEEGVKKREGLFVEKSVTATGLDPATNVFLYKDSLKRNNRQVPVFKFIHFSFQEFFTALYYILLDEKEHSLKVSELFELMEWEAIIDKPSPDLKERRSIPIPPVILFLYGLLNEEVSSSFLEKIELTVPHTIKLKKKEMRKTLKRAIVLMIQQYGIELFALHCLHELQDKRFVRKILKVDKSMDLYNVSLRSTDCWVLLYCLQCCPHVRYLNLMYCDLTAEKLKILQPALCMCETMSLSVEHLLEAGDLIRSLGESKILRELKHIKYQIIDQNITIYYSFPAFLNISLTCPRSAISSTDWSLFLERLSKTEKVADDSSALDEHVSLLLSSFHSVGLKTLDLKLVILNKSWASGIISLVQTCTCLQQLNVTGWLLEEGLMLLKKSLTDPHCTVIIKGFDWSHSCNKNVEIHFIPKGLKKMKELNISDSEPSGLNRQPLPVCQSCVHIGDSDQWVQVEPSVCTDEGGSEFRISTPAGRFECSRTRMRWVCAGDVTLQYRAVDERFLSEELERLQCERIGPVIDVTVISGKLEEAHLPHYACLAESDPSLTQSVKVLSVEDEGMSLESVELTRFHAKVLQPSFSPKKVLMKLGIAVKVHCDLLIFMTHKDPIILHVYFLPIDSLFEEKIKIVEKSRHQINLSRPETPLQMNKKHSLEVPGASVQPKAIKLRGDIKPNFFEVMHPVVDDINMTLTRVDDQKSVWTSKICKALFGSMLLNSELNLFPQVAVNFDKVQFFDRNWHAFIKSVKNVNNIADNLLQKQIIHEELYSEITHPTSTSEASMRKICSIVRKGSDTVKEMFISILLEEDPDLLNHLPLPNSNFFAR